MGVIRTVRRVSLVYIIVTAVSIYGVDQSFWAFKVLKCQTPKVDKQHRTKTPHQAAEAFRKHNYRNREFTLHISSIWYFTDVFFIDDSLAPGSIPRCIKTK